MDACPQSKCYRAEKIEGDVWTFVTGLLTEPQRLREDLERMIELKRNGLQGDPQREFKVWLGKLAETDRKRSGFQDMAAEGLITFDELRAKLADLDEARKVVERELRVLRHRQETIERLEQDRDALLRYYAGMVPETLDNLTPEDRHQVYRMLRLEAVVSLDGGIEVGGALGDRLNVCESEPTS